MSVSIRSRLLALVLALLVPAALGALWVVVHTYERERLAVERNLRDTSRALAMVVDREIGQRMTIARMLSLAPSLDELPQLGTASLLAFEDLARRSLPSMDGWVVLRSADGVLLDTRPDGPREATSAPRPLRAAPQVDPLTPPGTDPLAHASVSYPVERRGRIVAEVQVTLRPAELQRIVDGHELPPDHIAAVLDPLGALVARHPDGVTPPGRRARDELMSQLRVKREGLVESHSIDGRPTLLYFSTTPLGWTYVTAMPRPSWVGAVPTAVQQVASGALLLTLLGTLGALWVARGITRPFDRLRGAALQLRERGPDHDPGPTGLLEADEVAAVLRDAAHAVRQAQADLERRVDTEVSRVREAEQRISQGRRIEALGRLTGGVAHDVNNLLGVISNCAHLIQRQSRQPELQVPLAATLRAVEAGSRLTQHLLRIAGRQPVHPRTIDLAQHLPEAAELLRTVLGKRIRPAVQVASDTPRVRVDPVELELALINLALNARDAQPDGGEVRIEARLAAPDETVDLAPGRYAKLAVSDDGAGIADDMMARVFEPFFTTKDTGKGTGLGLSQVHGFCQQAGGTARIASTPGWGTTVSLLLPEAATAEDDDSLPVPADLGRVVHGRRLLLVEDNEPLADATAALLASYGCEVLRAHTPAEALAVLDSQPVDVVLSDIVMPGPIDGIALARELTRRRSGLPVVLVSGYSTSLEAARDFPVLHKPCTPQSLLAVLRDAMGAGHPAA